MAVKRKDCKKKSLVIASIEAAKNLSEFQMSRYFCLPNSPHGTILQGFKVLSRVLFFYIVLILCFETLRSQNIMTDKKKRDIAFCRF